MKSFIFNLLIFLCFTTIAQPFEHSWRYYTTGNTGIQGDYVEAIWIDHDGDPYLAGYTPSWEEGGFAKLIQSENKWINYSNVDYPVIGDINDVGSSRISDIEEDANGVLWMATWRGILKFDPAIGSSSLQLWDENNSIHPGGRTVDIAIAPDGSIWASILSVNWGFGGLIHFNPQLNEWQYWGYGSTNNNWPSLVGQCDNLSIQEKIDGNYEVWIDGEGWNRMIVFDSETELFTALPQNEIPGEVVALPGNKCVDDANNLWAFRYTNSGSFYSLDYRTDEGVWVTPPQPASNTEDGIWAFKAYGNGKALLVDGNSAVWKFNGTSWQNMGIWRAGGFSFAVDIDMDENIWVSGIGGAAKRDALTGNWQRYRVSNSSQIDYWVNDITFDNNGDVWMTGNAGGGIGGFQKFDGSKWTGYNNENYGLGYPFPFPTDNSEALYFRPSNGDIIVNPMFDFLHRWNGVNYSSLNYESSRAVDLVEDSQNRLWCLGEYYNLSYYSNNTWTDVPFMGISTNLKKDPTRAGTVWACSYYQVLRTDGSYNFSKVVDDFSQLNPQSDALTTVVPIEDGFAWVGTNQGLAKVNSSNGTYQFYSTNNSQIPGDNIAPLTVTPDGILWFSNFGSTSTDVYGLCWFDGVNFGIIPQQQTGGLPHAQIYDIEVKLLDEGYELWISCASRGIAVLTKLPAEVNYTIATSSLPTNGGVTDGGGTFTSGETCTVIATPNLGYSFSSWTENGVEIATTSNYSFSVLENRSLVANFCNLPDAASTISGNPTVCQGESGVTFSVPIIANATSYLWTLPNNVSGSSITNSIVADIGMDAISGNITVFGQNDCGIGTSSNLFLTVNELPQTPTISVTENILQSDAAIGNQWYSQNGIIVGATNQEYIAEESGDYYVITTALNCNSVPSNTISIVITDVENLATNALKVFPNPFSQAFTVDLRNNAEMVNLEIINIMGQTIYQTQFTHSTSINTFDFTPGMYILKIKIGKSTTYLKVIKK
jgi:streptogramin lyase